MKTLITVFAAFASLMLASPVSAQDATNRPDDTRHSVTVDAGLESAVAGGAGYTYRMRPSFWSHDVLVFGKLLVPSGGLDLRDTAIEAGLRTTAAAFGNLRLQVVLGPVLRNTRTNLFSANSVGVHTALLPGYQSERWGMMADLGYEKMLATQIRHSDLYRETFYDDAESGWYGNTAGTIRIGVRAGARVGPVQLSTRLGVIATEGGAPHLPPFYGTVGASYAF